MYDFYRYMKNNYNFSIAKLQSKLQSKLRSSRMPYKYYYVIETIYKYEYLSNEIFLTEILCLKHENDHRDLVAGFSTEALSWYLSHFHSDNEEFVDIKLSLESIFVKYAMAGILRY